ncbi:MAG TPA: hydroxyisourate hydrolase [Actinomycetes bacterium]|nr:hydroxyisourate hydrolase [Actinomycetes bacterium]
MTEPVLTSVRIPVDRIADELISRCLREIDQGPTDATGDWFEAQGVAGFYPQVTVVCRVEDPSDHYHVPLLLSPYGYSTYRGS